MNPAHWFRCLSGAAWLLTLAACGGGGSNDASSASVLPRTVDATGSNASGTYLASPAWLNAQSLQAAEATAKSTTTPLEKIASGQLAAWSDYANGNVARKSAAVAIPVYRFYNTTTTAHFYTTSETEKANILATQPQFQFDGTAFQAASTSAPGLSPVYRFYNTTTGVHFYTISETEKNNIVATLPQYHLEGPAYYASQVAGWGLTPLYRFYVPSRGFHFYTAKATERDTIIATLSATYHYEGPAYYVMESNWTGDKLPHTGITTSQCYGTNLFTTSDYFGTCGVTVLTPSLNVLQDSARTARNPMTYSVVNHPVSGAAMPVTSCVRDSVTGLIWEGKTDDGGLRDKDLKYTNQGGGAATDTSGYIHSVNASQLCGYSDWRLPSVMELVSLIDFGATAAPYANATWLPNTDGVYWSSDARSPGSDSAIAVAFAAVRYDYSGFRNTQIGHARLVRGSMGDTGSARFSYATVAYGSDAANNAVNDAVTGLQWRRCMEGQTWNGTTCTGAATVFTHREALVYANNPTLRASRWRMPSVKEGISLVQRNVTPPAPAIDLTAFPAVITTNRLWTSTPTVGTFSDPMDAAFFVDFGGAIGFSAGYRTDTKAVRLVR